jgi:hypothetical protein
MRQAMSSSAAGDPLSFSAQCRIRPGPSRAANAGLDALSRYLQNFVRRSSLRSSTSRGMRRASTLSVQCCPDVNGRSHVPAVTGRPYPDGRSWPERQWARHGTA